MDLRDKGSVGKKLPRLPSISSNELKPRLSVLSDTSSTDDRSPRRSSVSQRSSISGVPNEPLKHRPSIEKRHSTTAALMNNDGHTTLTSSPSQSVSRLVEPFRIKSSASSIIEPINHPSSSSQSLLKSSLDVPINSTPRRSSIASRPSSTLLPPIEQEGGTQANNILGGLMSGSGRPSVRRVSTFHMGTESIPSRRASFNPALLSKPNEDENANEFISLPPTIIRSTSTNESEGLRQISRTLSTIDPKQVELYLEQQKLDLENIHTAKSSSVRLISSEDSSASEFMYREISVNMSIAKRRWIMATTSIIRLGKSSNWFKNPLFVQDSKKTIIPEENTRPGIPITIKQKNAARLLSNKAKIVEVLTRDKFDRTTEQLNALESIFKAYPGLAKYSKNFRSKLIEKGSLIEAHAQRSIIKQGFSPLAIYYILHGSCTSESITVFQGKGYIRKKDLVIGESIGEFGLYDENEKRQESFYTNSYTLLLMIPRVIFKDLMRLEINSNRAQILEGLQKLLPFESMPPETINKIADSCQLYKFDVNIPLLKLGDRDRFYFILEGECRANRLIPFVMKDDQVSRSYSPGIILAKEEEVAYHSLSIGTFMAGDYFPKMNLARSEAMSYRLQKISLEKIILLLKAVIEGPFKKTVTLNESNFNQIVNAALEEETMELEDFESGIDLTVVTTDKVTCLSITKLDLLSILSEDEIRKMTLNENQGLLRYTLEEIQLNYLEKLQLRKLRRQKQND